MELEQFQNMDMESPIPINRVEIWHPLVKTVASSKGVTSTTSGGTPNIIQPQHSGSPNIIQPQPIGSPNIIQPQPIGSPTPSQHTIGGSIPVQEVKAAKPAPYLPVEDMLVPDMPTGGYGGGGGGGVLAEEEEATTEGAPAVVENKIFGMKPMLFWLLLAGVAVGGYIWYRKEGKK